MINKVTLVGRLGSDTETKEAKNGKPFTKLNLATTSGYYDNNKKWVEQTYWHAVLAWWKLEAKKGETVYVEGEINYTEDKKTIIKAYMVKVLTGAKANTQSNNEAEEKELPF
jgi:single stranded DNA-binding protein